MKILIISDSHGKINYIYELMEKEAPDAVISCGDFSEDTEESSFAFDNVPFYVVRGNCDYHDLKHKDEIFVELEGKKILVTHGHLYDAKRTYLHLTKRGLDLGADVVIFGHTHLPCLDMEPALTLFNPGALKNREYGIIKISKDTVDFIHKTI